MHLQRDVITCSHGIMTACIEGANSFTDRFDCIYRGFLNGSVSNLEGMHMCISLGINRLVGVHQHQQLHCICTLNLMAPGLKNLFP